jgi:hypothetical protein
VSAIVLSHGNLPSDNEYSNGEKHAWGAHKLLPCPEGMKEGRLIEIHLEQNEIVNFMASYPR